MSTTRWEILAILGIGKKTAAGKNGRHDRSRCVLRWEVTKKTALVGIAVVIVAGFDFTSRTEGLKQSPGGKRFLKLMVLFRLASDPMLIRRLLRL